ncbi:MAG TPA: metal-dependent transcriptional regulator [Candidatus Micrarchaeaceae archaeon]|nr:metal-dependent transcriptional regulator [Candidatus Micrarchaeaceae archaeon]
MGRLIGAGSGERSEGLSSTAARYLEATYYIAHEGQTVRPSHLAEWLAVSAPTVTGVMQRLHEQGLVEFNPDRSLRLTLVGEKLASEVVRRHRVVERWLTDGLGLDWATADLEAGRMSHVFSDQVLERIFEALGRPTTCPHGNEIPGAGMRGRELVSLFDLEPGVPAVISRISEVAEHEAPQLLRLLEIEGLKPGVRAEVRRETGAEALTVVVAGRQTALGLLAARSVWVERALPPPLRGPAESP